MIELEIVRFFNELSASIITYPSLVLSSYYFLIGVWIAFAVFVLVKDKKRTKMIAAALIIAIILHFAITEITMKQGIGDSIYFRERPYMVDEGITARGIIEKDTSFPSGHVSSFVALLTIIALGYRKSWPWAVVAGLLMAFSRIYNGMHYPTDVLAGAALGVAYGWVGMKISKRLTK